MNTKYLKFKINTIIDNQEKFEMLDTFLVSFLSQFFFVIKNLFKNQ